MKFSLDHPYKYDWKITDAASDIALLTDLVRSCNVKGVAAVTDLLQSESVLGIVIVNKNSQPATLFQHLPVLTLLNCDQNLLVAVSQSWEEEVFFIPKSDIDKSRWGRLEEIGEIQIPISSRVSYVPVRPQC